MLLPPVDEFRRPFIEPLGHLVMQAARADNLVIEFCSIAMNATEASRDAIAAIFRNWDEKARQTILDSILVIAESDSKVRAERCLSQLDDLKQRRHRAIHDAIDVGIFGGPGEGGYHVLPLRVGYKETGRETAQHIIQTDAGQIASLAIEYYEFCEELESILFNLERLP